MVDRRLFIYVLVILWLILGKCYTNLCRGSKLGAPVKDEIQLRVKQSLATALNE
jgi:hypothetical protein